MVKNLPVNARHAGDKGSIPGLGRCSDLRDNKTDLIGLNGVPGVEEKKKGQKIMA